MSKTDYSKIISGEPIKTIVRIKPPVNYSREDLKVTSNKISLLDQNNRLLEEFDVPEIYPPESPIQSLFDSSITPYLNPFIQGFSVSIFAFGSSGSGKTQTIEGNKREPGLILLFTDSLFSLLENKKYQTNVARNSQAQNFSYGVRVRYVEIIDEDISDLLVTNNNRKAEPLQVVYHEWEGPTVVNSSWITVNNSGQLGEVYSSAQRNRTNVANEFGKLSDKATSVFTLELIQTLELADTKENLILISKLNFFDLPSSDILLEDPEALRVRQGATLNKCITSLASVLKDLASTRNDYVFYENSFATHLMKDTLGGNCLTVGIFTVQHGDLKGSSLTLNFLKYARKIVNYPVVNDGKALGLLKKYRNEIIINQNNLGRKSGDGDNYNYKIVELEKKLIEDNLDKMRNADEKSRLSQKLGELREKYNQLVKSKSDLQAELIRSEEEKLEVSKALVELQIENTKIMEMLQNDKYDANNRLLNAEGDLLSLNMKEQQLLKTVAELQDSIRDINQEKREIEIEFVALKKNFITANSELEGEKKKNENIGIELINVVNENKALHEEINDIYKRSGNTNEENSKFILRIERLDKENQELREALLYSKSELERLKTELIKYDVMDQQHKLDLDTRKLELEKSIIDINREKNEEMSKIALETQTTTKKIRDEKYLWESQKMELAQKNKLYQRKIDEMEERIAELIKMNDELHTENVKVTIQLDEMRGVYRGKLLQFMNEQMNEKNGDSGKKNAMRLGYDMNAREELIRSYNEKEIQLNETIEKERLNSKNVRTELRALKNYAKNLKYLAEDWAPVGIPLPDILRKNPPVKLDDDLTVNGFSKIQGDDIEKLKRRNRKLEEELKMVQDQLTNQTNTQRKEEPDLQKRIYSEIEFLKGKPEILERTGSGDMNLEKVRKERNELQEENRKLVAMLKDNKRWDVYLLQRDNDKLTKILKEYELGDTGGPASGDSKNLKQKLHFFEKTVKQLEKERSELIVRCTMAEEQLKNMQEHLTKSTQENQRKIMELKKQIR